MNPFPGLRPFEPDEDHLFFGREAETDDLLRRLRTSRLVAVVGTSGSGKSSLVRSGLIPSLQSGFMAGAGSSWRVALMRPGEDPIGHLAGALAAPDVLGADGELDELAGTSRVLIEATLRRGTLGLVDAARQAAIPRDHNVLLVVDQFEELFRFRRSRQIAHSRDEAVAFVRLLLEAARQREQPIFIVLTMRSDFIGDCMDFPGLPDAVNTGLYLVGRMTRDALRRAVSGPVAVAGGAIAPRLVSRVLNDLGDDHDQLPVLQHALMRTWEHWERRQGNGAPIDIADYEAVGTVRDALSRHAEEAYEEAETDGGGPVAERLFKALTDTFSDPRGVRRPTSVVELAAICEAPEAEVIEVVEIFRRPGRSFLVPPPAAPLASGSIVDISHESLMRCWTRLIRWAEEERRAARLYVRLSQGADWFEEGTAGLWRNPELELGERWMRENRPTAAWARRYHERFDRALAFLDRSLREREREAAERERERRAKLRRTQWAAAVLAVFLILWMAVAYFAWRESRRAEANLALARAAVDESLSSAERDPARVGADVPQVQALRQELLEKAERFYVAFMNQEPRSAQARYDLALAHFRLGHINRLLERRDAAAGEYREAISRLERLAGGYPNRAEYRQALANAYNWLGETLRIRGEAPAGAEDAYNSALTVQRSLVAESPGATAYQEELARTLYNRGILRSAMPDRLEAAESDFREAIRWLEPLADASDQAAQELARAFNNLAGLLEMQQRPASESQALYERAIAIHERLVDQDPVNREYRFELARFCNNLAALLHDQRQIAEADRRSRQAVALLEGLARPAPSLAVERADAHTLRGWILRPQAGAEAEREYREALELFAQMHDDEILHRLPLFHLRFGDLLLHLAALPGDIGDAGSHRLLARGVALYTDVASRIAASGSPPEAERAMETLARVIPALPASEQGKLIAAREQLQRVLDRAAAPQ